MFATRLSFVGLLTLGLALAGSAQDKPKFETKFEVGKSFYQKLKTTVEQSIKLNGGGDVALRHEQTFFFQWTPTTIEKDKIVVKQRIEGIILKLDIGGQTIEYDSTNANPTGPAGNPGLAEFFRNLVGLEFTVTFNKDMAVEKVEGREQAIDKLKTVNPQMESVLKAILSEEAVKEMTDPSAGLSVPAGKAVGETWEKKLAIPMGPIGSYELTNVYTYKGKDAVQKELDRVEIKPTLTYKAPASGTEGLPFRIKSGELKTKEVKQGTALYDPKSGRVKEMHLDIVTEGDLEVTVQNADTKLKLYQEQKSDLETADTSFLPKAK